jgi:2-phospho-L-lactate guanylyltransferase
VTSDADAGAIAARHAIPTSADASGLNAALANAREEIARLALRPQRLMILPVDLGYATAEALADAAKLEPDVVINPDEHGRGTNFLLLSPRAERFRFCFGEESFSQHCLQARAAGLSLGVLDDPRLARDIDEPEQYIKWRRSTAFPRALRTAECVDSLAGQSAAT